MTKPHLDQSIGWVSLTEIRNVYIEAIRELDRYLWPKGGTPSRDLIIKHYETTQYRLLERAKSNYADYLRTAAGSPLPPREGTPDSREKFQEMRKNIMDKLR